MVMLKTGDQKRQNGKHKRRLRTHPAASKREYRIGCKTVIKTASLGHKGAYLNDTVNASVYTLNN